MLNLGFLSTIELISATHEPRNPAVEINAQDQAGIEENLTGRFNNVGACVPIFNFAYPTCMTVFALTENLHFTRKQEFFHDCDRQDQSTARNDEEVAHTVEVSESTVVLLRRNLAIATFLI